MTNRQYYPGYKDKILDIFPNDENLQVVNWQTNTDRLIATIKSKGQNFSQGLRDCTTKNIYDLLK